jgi:hypothetical protein
LDHTIDQLVQKFTYKQNNFEEIKDWKRI